MPVGCIFDTNTSIFSNVEEALIRKMGLIGPVFINLENGDEAARGRVKDLCQEGHKVNVLGLTCNDDDFAKAILDEGAHKAFFHLQENNVGGQIEMFKTFPKARVGIILPVARFSLLTQFQDVVSNVCWIDGNTIEMEALWGENKDSLTTLDGVYFSLGAATKASCSSVERLAAARHNTFPLCSPDRIDVLGIFIACLRTDRPDGLYTTVVCDPQGVCLGLVYSNEESIRTAVEDGRGVYWSRSRGGLWRKGDTSGAVQILLGLSYDCDSDALRFTVVQQGDPPAFCHLGTYTCWGPVGGLRHLQDTLESRKASAPVGSYTKRLFDDQDLLRKKLLEEVQELVEAEEPDHIAAEAADVVYFTMVRCVAGGIELGDIERHLDKRALKVSRRPGNAKEWRTAAAEAALEK